jgi:hypothetical protein
MTLTINIPGELEARLKGEAARQGIGPAEFARRLIEQHLAPPAPHDDDATLELLAQWTVEDATSDPAEIAARRQEWEQFKRSMNENRFSGRRLFP